MKGLDITTLNLTCKNLYCDKLHVMNGEIEIFGKVPLIDFHCNNDPADYTGRIAMFASNELSMNAPYVKVLGNFTHTGEIMKV